MTLHDLYSTKFVNPDVCRKTMYLEIEVYTVSKSPKIPQLVLKPVIQALYVEGELGTSDRGIGGFGSTGLT